MRVVVFGGGGFVGRRTVAELCARGHEVVVPTRDRERAKRDLIVLPGARATGFDPDSPASVARVAAGAEVAVNLVGVLHERRNGDFERIHGELVRRLVAECRGKVRLFIQVSALGASASAASAYLRSKAKGERVVRDAGAMRCAVVRPSVVFGRGDSFASMFAALARRLPFLTLPCAEARFQPVAVSDLAKIIAVVAESGAWENRTLSVGGPDVFSLREIVEKTAAAAGHPRPIVPLGDGASYAFAAMMEMIPFVRMLTRDNVRSMRAPSVCPRESGNDAARVLGGVRELVPLEVGLAEMFPSSSSPADFRSRAGR